MGLLSLSEYYGLRVAVLLLAASFVGWVLHFVYFIVYKSVSTERRSSVTFREDSVLCPCVFKNSSPAQWLMGSTITINVFYMSFLLLNAVGWALYLGICEHCEKDGRPTVVAAITGLGIVCSGIGYWLLLVTYFERLRLTFSGTPLQLPKWTPKALYCFISVEMLVWVVWFGSRHEKPAIAGVCIALHGFGIVAAIVVLVTVFYKKTMSVAKSTTDGGQRLAETAVRMTLVVAVSLLSTVTVIVLWVSVFSICPQCRVLREVAFYFFCFDTCINAFCLMCAFRQAEGHYQWAFGGAHNWFLARVLAASGEAKDGVRVALERVNTATSEDKSNGTAKSNPTQV